MAVKLRLMRMGKTKQPTYRVVAADSRSPRDGRFIEILGVYAPRGRSTSNPDAVVEINNDKALKWLRQGALPTDRVERLLKQSGAWDQFPRRKERWIPGRGITGRVANGHANGDCRGWSIRGRSERTCGWRDNRRRK